MERYQAHRHLLWGRVLVEKEPLEPIAFADRDYHGFIRNVWRLFPAARVVFMLRRPLDSIWSMSRRTWGHSLGSGEYRSLPLETHMETWDDNAELIARLPEDPRAYVCSFDRLVSAPEAEPARIRRFVGVRAVPAFEPRATKQIGFDPDERDRVLRETRSRWEQLLSILDLNEPGLSPGSRERIGEEVDEADPQGFGTPRTTPPPRGGRCAGGQRVMRYPSSPHALITHRPKLSFDSATPAAGAHGGASGHLLRQRLRLEPLRRYPS